MEPEQTATRQSSLVECKIKVQHLRLQLEQHDKDYSELLKQKQDYFYENLAWIVVLAVAAFILYILNQLMSRLPTGTMLIPFCTGMELVCIFLLARVIYLSRHFIGMRDYKSGKFTTFKALIEEQLILKQNAEKLLARAEKELAEKQAAADAAEEKEKRTVPEEDRMIMRWDQHEENPDTPENLSDTARLIHEALEKDE